MYQGEINPHYEDLTLCIFCDSTELNSMAYELARDKAAEYNKANPASEDEVELIDEDFYDEAYAEIRNQYGSSACAHCYEY